MNFVHVHASGRFDRSPDSLEAALDNYVYNEHADLITLTEISSKARSAKLLEKGWGHVQSPAGGRKSDSAIMYKQDTWTHLYTDYSLIVEGDGKGILPVWAAIGVFKHKATGNVVVVSSSHMPRSVEGATGFSKSEAGRVRAAIAGANRLRNTNNKLKKSEGADAVIMAADWNMNIKREWVRKWFKQFFPYYEVNWQGKLPERGTLGKRIIDIALIKGLTVINRQILAHRSSSDHTAYKETLAFKKV